VGFAAAATLLVATVGVRASAQPPVSGRSRTYDLLDVALELRVDEREAAFEGAVVNTILPFDRATHSVEFDCAGLAVRSVTLDGAELPFEIVESRLRVEIGETGAEGRPLPIRIAYGGSNPRRGLHFIRPDETDPDRPTQIWSQGQPEDNRFWIPTYDFPNDPATVSASFTVRRPLVAVSNGGLVRVEDASVDGGAEGEWRTFRFRSEQPIATYLIAVAIGEWETYRDAADGVPLEYHVPPGTGEARARRSLGATPEMLRFFREKIGVPFPYGKYAQVCVRDFVAGGMENAACTILTDRTLHDERTGLEESSEGLVAHELAHQWFGDLVTCRDWSHLWLNEGFATYFAALWTRERRGEDAFRLEMREQQESFLRRESRNPTSMVVPTWEREANRGRESNNEYTKGASVLYMLHGLLGEELWWKAIRSYLESHAFGNVDSHEFRIAVEEATGRELEWFFRQWVYGKGHPKLEVRESWEAEAGRVVLTVRQTQAGENGVGVFFLPVPVEITTEAGTRSITVWCDEAEERFELEVDGRPLLVRFDKGGRIPMDLDFEKSTDELLYQLAHDDDVLGRRRAASRLTESAGGGEGDDATAPVLVRRLGEEPSPEIRAILARAVGRREDARAREALLAALSDPEARVRRAAASALSRFPGEASVAALRRVLAEDPAYGVQAEAVRGLARLGGDGLFETLVEAATRESEGAVVTAVALEALSGLDDPRVVDLLLARLDAGTSAEVRRAAVNGLRECASRDAFREMRPRIAEGLVPLLERERGFGQVGVVRALAATEEPQALEALEKLEVEGRMRGIIQSEIETLRKKLRPDAAGEPSKEGNEGEKPPSQRG